MEADGSFREQLKDKEESNRNLPLVEMKQKRR